MGNMRSDICKRVAQLLPGRTLYVLIGGKPEGGREGEPVIDETITLVALPEYYQRTTNASALSLRAEQHCRQRIS